MKPTEGDSERLLPEPRLLEPVSASERQPPAERQDSPEQWLPPQYHNPGYLPAKRGGPSGAESNVVLLPTADGSFAPVSNRIVHVQHAGEKVPLKVLTRQQRMRRRVIFNLISALISLLILGFVFWWLTRRSQ